MNNSAGNDFRRRWDRDEYERKAQERLQNNKRKNPDDDKNDDQKNLDNEIDGDDDDKFNLVEDGIKQVGGVSVWVVKGKYGSNVINGGT